MKHIFIIQQLMASLYYSCFNIVLNMSSVNCKMFDKQLKSINTRVKMRYHKNGD